MCWRPAFRKWHARHAHHMHSLHASALPTSMLWTVVQLRKACLQAISGERQLELTPCATTVAASPAIFSSMPVELVRVKGIGGCSYGLVDAMCARQPVEYTPSAIIAKATLAIPPTSGRMRRLGKLATSILSSSNLDHTMAGCHMQVRYLLLNAGQTSAPSSIATALRSAVYIARFVYLSPNPLISHD